MSFYLVAHPEYSYPFPGKHRFPMEKFTLLHRYLKQQGIATKANTLRPGKAKTELLIQAHCPDYIDAFIHNKLDSKALRRMGLPWSQALVKRSLLSPNGTFLTANLALEHGIACHLAGGTHHAHYNFGSGFCALNDLAITAKGLIARARHKNQTIPRVLIFDCDVHQGDGTASILKDEAYTMTCSVHCDKNFPARKAQSDMDVAIAKACYDDEYLHAVNHALTLAINQFKPHLILYDAGVDIYEHDPLGLLNISLAGIQERDYLVLQQCKMQGIPVATVIGGGYDDNRQALAERHAIVVEQAHKLFN